MLLGIHYCLTHTQAKWQGISLLILKKNVEPIKQQNDKEDVQNKRNNKSQKKEI